MICHLTLSLYLDPCIAAYVAISLTSIALLISVSINVAFYLLRRKGKNLKVCFVRLNFTEHIK